MTDALRPPWRDIALAIAAALPPMHLVSMYFSTIIGTLFSHKISSAFHTVLIYLEASTYL
jgi:hypothetical protein